MTSIIEKFEGAAITDEIIVEAAKIFSAHYGVWGSQAAEQMGKWAKEGEYYATAQQHF